MFVPDLSGARLLAYAALMHVLVDITHPAHVHFFRHAINTWRERRDRVTIVARRKDIAIDLLERYGYAYTDLGPAMRGLFGLSYELFRRNLRLRRLVRRDRPDVMVAIGGTFIAHVGWLERIPALIFTDTENATLGNRITFPFATKIITPDCYEATVPADRHITYAGYHELAYMHPNRFTPDPAVLGEFGLGADEPFIVLRLVGWAAAHDFHDSGLVNIQDAVAALERFGRVVISSEKALPADLQSRRIVAKPELMHHLVAYARLLIGESATMASEAAVMGTPAIFISTSTRGYTNQQESRYDMTYTFSGPNRQREGLDKAIALLSDPATPAAWQQKRQRLLADKVDVTNVILSLVDQTANARKP